MSSESKTCACAGTEALRNVAAGLVDAPGRTLSAGISGASGQGRSFWAMALTPEYAAEVTLQPIRRFGFDAAILFSDILTVPEALGQKVTFTFGEGPSLKPVTTARGFVRRP